jgi:hypothetical protein
MGIEEVGKEGGAEEEHIYIIGGKAKGKDAIRKTKM